MSTLRSSFRKLISPKKGSSSKYSKENVSRKAGSFEAEDLDAGIMSEVETSATAGSGNFKRSSRIRSSLPIVRSNKSPAAARAAFDPNTSSAGGSLGLVFLQLKIETKKALLPNELTSLDTIKALFVRSFPRQLNMNYMESRNVRIYIHDPGRDVFYELDDLRDVRDRSVLRIYEQDLENGTWQPVGGLRAEHPRLLNQRMNQEIMAARQQQQQLRQQQQQLQQQNAGRIVDRMNSAAAAATPLTGNWMDDPSYFSEPEFESASLSSIDVHNQQQHIHRSNQLQRGSMETTTTTAAQQQQQQQQQQQHQASPVNHQSQSQYYGTIIIPAYRTQAMMQQHQQQQQQQNSPQASRVMVTKAYPGYTQTLPRNMTIANTTYATLPSASSSSPIKSSPSSAQSSSSQQQQMIHHQIQMHQQQQKQQQVLQQQQQQLDQQRKQQQQDNHHHRSVSPDLVSKRQLKDQMIMSASSSSSSGAPGAPPKPQRSFSSLIDGQLQQQRNHAVGIMSPIAASPMSPGHSAFRPLPDRPYSVAGQFAPQNGTLIDRRSFPEYTGYLSSPERRLSSGEMMMQHQQQAQAQARLGNNNIYGTTGRAVGFENELYGYVGVSSRPSSVIGGGSMVDDIARIKMENMERQLMNLTGLVQAALVSTPANPIQPTAASQNDTKEKSKPAPPPKPYPFGMISGQQQVHQRSTTDAGASVLVPISGLMAGGSPAFVMRPEVVQELRSLRSKARGLKQEFVMLRKIAMTESQGTRDALKETCDAIKTSLSLMNPFGDSCTSGSSSDAVERKLRLDRLRLSRDEESYRQEKRKLEDDLTNLESQVEELRSNVINRRCKVNMSDVESMAHVLSRSSKVVADLKLRYPHLQEMLKIVMQQEMEIVVREEKFLKEEPEKLDSALRRCKKLTGTLVTLKRLASVQEQRSSSTGSPQGHTLLEKQSTTTSGSSSSPRNDMMMMHPLASDEYNKCTSDPRTATVQQHRPKSTPPSSSILMPSLIDQTLDAVLHGTAGVAGGGEEEEGVEAGGGGGDLDDISESNSSIDSQNGVAGGSGTGEGGEGDLPGGNNNSNSNNNIRVTARQQLLEDRHQELLRKQRLLQDQYTKLQILSRRQIHQDLLPDLKKTGSESNIMSKSLIASAAAAVVQAADTSSLSHLIASNRQFATLQTTNCKSSTKSANLRRRNSSVETNGCKQTDAVKKSPLLPLLLIHQHQEAGNSINGFSSAKNHKPSVITSSPPSSSSSSPGDDAAATSSSNNKQHTVADTQKIYETDIL